MALQTELRRGWREHRPFFWVATALFVLGTLLGVAMVGRVDLFAWLGVEGFQDLVPAELTVVGLYLNNARALLMMVAGIFTAGLLTVVALVFNGIILGYIGLPIAQQEGLLFVVVGILPHGILELPALFLGGAIAFRIVTNTALRIVGRREVVLGRGGWRRAGLLLVTALVVLAVAAVIEIYVTSWLLGLLVG